MKDLPFIKIINKLGVGYAVCGLRFDLMKKNSTFATDFGPIVQWIEWRFPKP